MSVSFPHPTEPLRVGLASAGSRRSGHTTTPAGTIPIVSGFGGDPVESGLVASFARPGGNLTGFSVFTAELTAKRFELLCELVPRAGVVALLVNPNYQQTERIIRDAQAAAGARGVQLAVLKTSSRQPWVPLPADGRNFETQPPSGPWWVSVVPSD